MSEGDGNGGQVSHDAVPNKGVLWSIEVRPRKIDKVVG